MQISLPSRVLFLSFIQTPAAFFAPMLSPLRFRIGCCALLFPALLAPAAIAATSTWTGAAGVDFSAPGNWSPAPPVDSLTADIAAFSGALPANQPALSASRAIAGLVFGTPAGGWTLSASDSAHVLSLGGSGVSATAQVSGASTVSASLLVSANQTWAVGGGSSLRVTGSLRAGASFNSTFPGQLVIGGSNAGELVLDPAAGRAVELYTTAASAAAVQINQRLSLGAPGGSSAAQNIVFNSASAGLRVSSTGVLTVNSGAWRTNDLGSNNTNAFTGVLNITGGTLAAGGARYLGQFSGAVGTTVNLSGGSFIVTGGGASLVNSGHLGLGAHGANTPAGTINFNVTGGLLDVARGSGNFPGNSTLPSGIVNAALNLGGVANTTVLFNQSGGVVRVGATAGSHVFTGASNNNTFANLSIGSAFANNHAAYTLAGGELVVAGSIQSATSPGGVANFNLLGGTLAAAAVDATTLGHSPTAAFSSNQTASSVAIGTLVNRGAVLAPGGRGVAGRTLVTGSYQALAGSTLDLDIGGSTPATTFQNASGGHDTLVVSGNVTLGGNLTFSFLPGYLPSANSTFNVLSCNGTLSGAFANAPAGLRVVSADGLHTLLVDQTATGLTLGQYAPVATPIVRSATSPSVIAEGDSVVLGVEVSSLGSVTYEWRRDGALIPGASSSTLTLLNFQSADAGLYEVTVRNVAGAATRSFPVRVTVPPSASSVVLDAGSARLFSASSAATAFRWILDGETVSTAATFSYAPARREVGTHWLRVIETYPDNSIVTRHWVVRVRIPIAASALFYHVSPTGSDTNAGTASAPFRTLEKARDTIRALSSAQRAGGVTVYLREGVHSRTTTFTLSAQDSGTEAAPIFYAAFPGETPVLTSARVLASSAWAPLASTEHSRLAPGVSASRVWETSVAGNARAAAHPAVFNEWVIFNALRSSQNGGLFEVFRNGERLNLSRYPNVHPTDDTLTPNLLMDGVAAGVDIPPAGTAATGYLNVAGTYTLGAGGTVQVGGAFHYSLADAPRVARWQTAITRGGLWLAGYWRVPWQLNGVRVGLIDTNKRVIGLVTNPSNASAALVSNGIGDKYTRPVGSKKEPWFALNLLEEIDVPGEWSVDFSRQRLYVLLDRDGAPADGEIELSDVGVPLFQLNAASDIVLRGLTFRRHLGVNIQILNGGSRNLVLGCRFIQAGNMAVDINGGVSNGVLSSDFEKLASGGVMLRGGSLATDGTPVPADHFAVNNKFRSFGEVVRVYQAAVDVGYGGPMGNWGLPTVGMRVAQNDLRSSPHAGILWNGHRHVIEYNEVSDFTRLSNDLGAIYRFGRNADFRTIIRYNHLHDSPLGEGVYNDMDHVRTPVYGNTVNLKTPASAQRGYGFWSNTHTTTGEANPALPMGLQVYNNVFVNTRAGASFHSATGGRIENNISYRPLGDHFRWFRITTNTTTNTAVVATSNAATLQSGPNLGYASDPGFVDYANDDLRLRPDAQVYRDLPGFDPVPLELAGLRADETRPASDTRAWTPFVVTGAAYSVGANTAVFSGSLVYPQFDANATVRVYWGTNDGGSDPAAWQNVAVLGQPGSGHLAHARSDLAPATRYFFRFHAVNSAGEHWAERSNSTTTFPLVAAPSGGLASAASADAPASLAFDGDSATAWRTAAGVSASDLTYRFANDGAVVVTRYSVTSAADSPARDPRDWRFEGSLDGFAWSVLDTRSGQVFSARGQTLSFGFLNAAAFKFYRLVVTANNGDPSALQLAELRLFSPNLAPDTVGPIITTPGNLVVEAATSSGAQVNFEVSAEDVLSGLAPAVASPASGSLFPIGVTTVTVTAADAAGNLSTSTFTVTVTVPSLPAPWSISQINPFAGVAPGSVIANGPSSFQVTGAGGASTGGATGDLWTGVNDSFTYVSQPWSGDGVFTARVASFTSTDVSAKAGIIFRETTSAGSRYSAVYLIRNNGGSVHFQHKTATSGSTSNVNFFNGSVTNRGIPEWIRLVRQGDAFGTFYSSDGVTWTELGTARLNVMGGASLSVGFCVVPRTGGATAVASFDNIGFLSPVQSWRQAHFGVTADSGPAAHASDPDGDGQSNLLEYALGTTPTSAASASLLVPATTLLEGSSAPHLELRFNRVADPLLFYAVEATDNLASPWTVIWTSTGAANLAGPVTVSDVVELAPDRPRRFLRLRVTMP